MSEHICSLGCAKAHTIVTSSEKGRCLMADNAYKIGDIVLSNVPYAHVLFDRCLDNRCSYCFCKYDMLSACSKCKYVRYCSRECQAASWAQHKFECKLISKMTKMGMANAGRSIDADFRLLVSTYGVIQSASTSPESATFSSECRVDENGTSICGSTHLFSMPSAGSATKFREDMPLLEFISSVLKEKVPTTELSDMMLRFHCNNFGITSSLIDCIGAGVYPCAALLNHSCTPNCVLRYVVSPKKPVTLQIVAVKPVAVGEELCHSYVELVESSIRRQHMLRSTYQFACTKESCARCFPDLHSTLPPVLPIAATASTTTATVNETVSNTLPPVPPAATASTTTATVNETVSNTLPPVLPIAAVSTTSTSSRLSYCPTVAVSAIFASSGSYETVIDEQLVPSEDRDVEGTGVTSDTATATVTVNVDSITTDLLPGVTTSSSQKVLTEVEALKRQHDPHTASLEDEIKLYRCCKQKLSQVLGPFHIELYKVHGQLLTSYLEAGEWANALSMCYQVVGFLHLLFGTVLPYHPLLGLQLFTLGDILVQNGLMVPEGVYVYSQAREILRVTHGPTDELVLRLDELLQDAADETA